MTDINVNVVAHELDPTKKYIIEISRGDLTLEATEQLVKVLRENGIVGGIVVMSETGQAIKVKEIPEEGK